MKLTLGAPAWDGSARPSLVRPVSGPSGSAIHGSAAASRFEALLSRAPISPVISSALAESARAARLQTSARTAHEWTIAEIASGVCGPMLVAYVAWILTRAQTLGLSRLYFLARDGQIMLEIARRIIDNYGLSIDARYLYASRQSLHLPAVDDLGADDLDALDFQAGQSMGDILIKLGLDQHLLILKRLSRAGFDLADASKSLDNADMDRLVAVLRSDAVLRAVRANAESQKSRLIDYLRQEGFFARGPFGVVDLGWHGRLQRSLCVAVRSVDETVRERLHGFYFRLRRRPCETGALESFVKEGGAPSLIPYIRVPLFEAICAAPHGTTRGYARQARGDIAPVLAEYQTGLEPADLWGLAVHQSAIKAFTSNLLAALNTAGEDLLVLGPELAGATALVLRAFVSFPTRQEADAMGCYPHPTNQRHSHLRNLAPRLRRGGGFEQFVSTDWLEGSLARSLPPSVAAIALALLEPGRRSRFYPTNARC